MSHAIKPKHDYIGKDKHKKDSYIKKRAVLMNDQEKKRHNFLNALNSIRKEKNTIKDDKRKLKIIEKAKVHAKEQERKDDGLRATKKRRYRDHGKLEMKKSRTIMD